MVIGMAGQCRQGKDVAADHLAHSLGLSRGAFATGVKQVFCEHFGVDMAFVERWKVVDEPPPGFLMSVRKALQFIGDGFRRIKDDVWVERLFRDHPDSVVVSDLRYRNELAAVKERGGHNVLIYRPGFLNDDPNGSESQIRTFVEHFMGVGNEGRVEAEGDLGLVDFFIVNDGTIDDLYAKMDEMVVPHLPRRPQAMSFSPSRPRSSPTAIS
jgi:hypothetical protein